MVYKDSGDGGGGVRCDVSTLNQKSKKQLATNKRILTLHNTVHIKERCFEYHRKVPFVGLKSFVTGIMIARKLVQS